VREELAAVEGVGGGSIGRALGTESRDRDRRGEDENDAANSIGLNRGFTQTLK
jgi:hypothetical protein